MEQPWAISGRAVIACVSKEIVTVQHRYLRGFLLLGLTFLLLAQPTTVFDTGQYWILATSLQQTTYMMGYRDGFATASQFAMPDPNLPADVLHAGPEVLANLVNCLKPMNLGQMRDIITRYLMSHPELVDKLRIIVVTTGLITACRERGWR